MSSLSLNDILHRARALCRDTGMDPDQLGRDGKPEWFRFIGAARDSLRHDQQTQDPLALLREIEKVARDSDADVARAGSDAESVNPLEKLQALFLEVTEGGDAPAPDALGAQSPSESDLAPTLHEAGPAHSIGCEHSDPLEALKALEALGMDAVKRDKAGDPPAPDDD